MKSEGTLMANLKTAVMLFVVTVVFVITFLPAFLMALRLIPYHIIVFYFYFANNVANPVIYSFMNQVRYTHNAPVQYYVFTTHSRIVWKQVSRQKASKSNSHVFITSRACERSGNEAESGERERGMTECGGAGAECRCDR